MESCYGPLSGDSVFTLSLPVGLVRLEIRLLLEHHISIVTQSDQHQPLLVQFNAGTLTIQCMLTDNDNTLGINHSSIM